MHADYDAYAIMVYRKLGETTLKLYGEAVSPQWWLWVVCVYSSNLRLNRCVKKLHLLCHYLCVLCFVCRQVCRQSVRASLDQVWGPCWKTGFGTRIPLPLPHIQYVSVHLRNQTQQIITIEFYICLISLKTQHPSWKGMCCATFQNNLKDDKNTE